MLSAVGLRFITIQNLNHDKQSNLISLPKEKESSRRIHSHNESVPPGMKYAARTANHKVLFYSLRLKRAAYLACHKKEGKKSFQLRVSQEESRTDFVHGFRGQSESRWSICNVLQLRNAARGQKMRSPAGRRHHNKLFFATFT